MIRACSYLKNRRGAFGALLVLAAMAAVPMPVWGQWNGTNPVWTNSNVGIGTPTPSYQLDIAGVTRLQNFAVIASGTGVLGYFGPYANITGTGGLDPALYTTTGKILLMNGNVGIGTTNPGSFKLAVEGTIGARDVMVTSANPWPDYVFRPGYRLRPLSEVSKFIQANGHLPDIPTEAEVKEKGVSLGDMQAKLLAKVEELTLHMIQQEKENRELRENLTQENHELRERLARLEKGAATDSAPVVAK